MKKSIVAAAFAAGVAAGGVGSKGLATGAPPPKDTVRVVPFRSLDGGTSPCFYDLTTESHCLYRPCGADQRGLEVLGCVKGKARTKK